MTDDLRARIAAALEECRVLTPDAQADAVMAVVGPAFDWLMTQAEQYQARAHAAEKSLAEHGVKLGLADLDGTRVGRVSLLSGLDADEIHQLGGIGEDGAA